MLLWRFHPNVRVDFTWEYIAGRERSADRLAAWQGGTAGLHAYFERHQVDGIVLNTGVGHVVPGLTERGWRLVHLDDRYFIMVRPTAAQRLPIYTRIRPWEYAPVDHANATSVLAEAEHALRSCPGGAIFARGYKAKALRALGRHQEALEAALNIPPSSSRFGNHRGLPCRDVLHTGHILARSSQHLQPTTPIQRCEPGDWVLPTQRGFTWLPGKKGHDDLRIFPSCCGAEVLRNRTTHGEASLRVPGRFEVPQAPLPLARRLMGVLRAVVQRTVLPMFDARYPHQGVCLRTGHRFGSVANCRWRAM